MISLKYIPIFAQKYKIEKINLKNIRVSSKSFNIAFLFKR